MVTNLYFNTGEKKNILIKVLTQLRKKLVMKKKSIIFILSGIILTEISCIFGLCICHGLAENTDGIIIREIPQQTVLYTIYRGNNHRISEAINELYTLADSKNIQPCGPVSICCLNSPLYENDSHKLIEIQIPVEAIAINRAGTLGQMTDIKVLPAMKVAVAAQPNGDSNSNEIIANLFTWINKKGYVVKGRMRQTVLNSINSSYGEQKTEFFIPVDRLPAKNHLTFTMDSCYM